MIDPRLHGRTVVITGANNPHGIGAAIASAFAAVGANLFLHYYHDLSIAGDVNEPSLPGGSFYLQQRRKPTDEVFARTQPSGTFEADLADSSAIPKLFDEAERVCGPVDVLINNAAAWTPDTFIPEGSRPVSAWPLRTTPLTAGTFERQFLVNTRAPALLMAEFAKRHVNRQALWGRIINISTDGAEAFPSEISYGASKLALEGYTRSAAGELGQFGVTVNVLALGPVQTGWIDPELERRLLPTIALGRIGQPSDIADVVVFLASDQARWITGQRIFVGGGHRM